MKKLIEALKNFMKQESDLRTVVLALLVLGVLGVLSSPYPAQFGEYALFLVTREAPGERFTRECASIIKEESKFAPYPIKEGSAEFKQRMYECLEVRRLQIGK